MDDVKLNTSWSDDDLSSLCRIENHKIVKDRDSNYRWYHKLGGVWGVHSIWVFDDYRKPSAYLHFWLAMWLKELRQRECRAIRLRTSKNRKARLIKKSLRKAMVNKILELNKLFPEYSKQELANELDVSLSTVQRALKRQNKKAQ